MKLTTQKKMLAICSQAELGRRLNRRAQTVNGWFKKKVPGELVVRVPALEKELLKRLQNQYGNCSLVIRTAGGDSLTVFGGDKGDKTKVEEILQETWESAGDWFY